MLQHLESTSHRALKKDGGRSIDRCQLIMLSLSVCLSSGRKKNDFKEELSTQTWKIFVVLNKRNINKKDLDACKSKENMIFLTKVGQIMC